MSLAEYIWMDGNTPVQTLRSKTRVIDSTGFYKIEDLPVWSFDGSSTNQSPGGDSDLLLKPIRRVKDPIRGTGNYLVLCEVLNGDGTPHESNTRSKLRKVLEDGAEDHEAWFGFEQEYTLYEGRRPLGWPTDGVPSRPQGPYYCGIGADEVAGRPLVEAHLKACLDAGIKIYGVNAEVMLGQWEFQIGPRDYTGADPLIASDHLWLARWLLYRLGEDFGISATLACKPEAGDWNGAGMHTNFSTSTMRQEGIGLKAIEDAIAKLGAPEIPAAHIAEYGQGLEERLTGLHETCPIDQFRSGVSDRGASVRIPRHVADQGFGYLEDRRPGANADPYRVCARILQTVCETSSAALAQS